jgi:two-component system, chemotaxis family, CheB/CheR fusion protein
MKSLRAVIWIAEVNNDLTNLLRNVNIPIVMVDRNLRIRRFTPVAQRTLKLIPADVGRSIIDLRSDVEVPQLEELISEVMHTLSTKEVEVQDRRGHWYNLQVRPYETSDNKWGMGYSSLTHLVGGAVAEESEGHRLRDRA